MIIKALILAGDGINCEKETAYAFEQAGAKSHIFQLKDFYQLETLDDFDILALPGGFSYGDEIKSGKVLAERIKYYQGKNIQKFINDKKPVLGICNGFQILIQLGVFDIKNRNVTLEENSNSKFINKWVNLNVHRSNNLWLQNLPENISLPVRHKEGKIQVIDHSQIIPAITYEFDINGSFSNIAALSNKNGNILGLMPHPEAAINNLLLPHSIKKENNNNIALQIFKNAVKYGKGLKHEN